MAAVWRSGLSATRWPSKGVQWLPGGFRYFLGGLVWARYSHRVMFVQLALFYCGK